MTEAGRSTERDAARVLDAELHALLFPEQTVEWRPTVITPDCGTEEVCWWCDPLVNQRNPRRKMSACVHTEDEYQPAIPGPMTYVVIPRYRADDDWAGMRAVIEAMRERGWGFNLDLDVGADRWNAVFDRYPSDAGLAREDTAPQAVAQAAKAALEREAGQ